MLHELTPRENEVLALIAQGKRNKEIARILQIEEVTVENHARHIFNKLGVTNRTEAAVRLACTARKDPLDEREK